MTQKFIILFDTTFFGFKSLEKCEFNNLKFKNFLLEEDFDRKWKSGSNINNLKGSFFGGCSRWRYLINAVVVFAVV